MSSRLIKVVCKEKGGRFRGLAPNNSLKSGRCNWPASAVRLGDPACSCSACSLCAAQRLVLIAHLRGDYQQVGFLAQVWQHARHVAPELSQSQRIPACNSISAPACPLHEPYTGLSTITGGRSSSKQSQLQNGLLRPIYSGRICFRVTLDRQCCILTSRAAASLPKPKQNALTHS